MALKILNLPAFQEVARDFENKQIQIKNAFIFFLLISHIEYCKKVNHITDIAVRFLKKIYHPVNSVQKVNNQRLFRNAR